MPFDPIHWARMSAGGRYKEQDGSRLLNYYASRAVLPEEAKASVILQATPGYAEWAQIPPHSFDQGGMTYMPTGDDIGIFGMLSVNTPTRGKRLYGISNAYEFFEISQGGLATNDIARGYDPIRGTDSVYVHNDVELVSAEADERITRPIRLVTDGVNVMFVNNRKIFFWKLDERPDGVRPPSAPPGSYYLTSNVKAPIPDGIPNVDADPDAELEARDWVDCGWVDGYFIVVTSDGQIFHSLLNSVDFDQLDFARAEADPDGIVGLEILNRRLYIFGSSTIEQWYNAGRVDFTFARDNSFVSELGAASRASIARNEEIICFVASNRTVAVIHGPKMIQISTDPVNDLLSTCILEQCRAFTYTEAGHRFYSLTMFFRDGSVQNWTYDFNTALWHERTEASVLCTAHFDDRNLIGREGSSSIFELHRDIFTEDGVAIEREAITPVITANEQRARMPSFQVDMPQRLDADPADMVSIEISDDGQRSWTDPKPRQLRRRRLKWNRLGQFRNRHVRLRTSVSREADILNAYVETIVDMN